MAGTAGAEAKKTVSGWDFLPGDGAIRCVFSSTSIVKLGQSAMAQRHESTLYWYVEQVEDDLFEARKINAKNVPAGNAEAISLRRLLNEFTPRLAYYEDVVLPAMKDLEKILDQGDRERAHGRLYSAEMQYARARTIEERNVRALYGLGLIFLNRREYSRARMVLSELVDVKAAFDGKNQHLFNEFGIGLRKSGLFDEASAYYRRALDYVKDDENLFYNLARTRYEKGDWEGCLEALIVSNRLNPDLPVARELFRVIVGLADDERLLERYGKPPVPPEVAGRARNLLAAQTGTLVLDEEVVVFDMERGRARMGIGPVPVSGAADATDAGGRAAPDRQSDRPEGAK
ncbi:MAG: tetratricopeptide repeat protein [Pseudodesulfovibrio sp.]|uniref:tetratricopeptide repeat protein n=1 Tax=Pseudodesulfovibrio TaxID=2035811 RepID=UPI0002E18516|nr:MULTISPECIES: tetratricopeptide repeat protein [Pseudodesulfovibrio]MBU4191208.1 tetratricopeptide repeat protein [Pseudomonadota bacterium]MBU4244301.1 tetratricopeptide repeat protein [Pseudomonadota bacterium]MBU4377619.1 tetratricopeptide repeat protein [Pseudomonadota bacterium]MBU4520832.1 tetratricopeptide repeat protein [Pseudomonadota bacterium]MBU4558582.1 tetratricopeptide repeat protein [Pseudomonadota bacterium]